MNAFSVFNLNIQHGRNRESAIWPPRVSKTEVQHNFQKIINCIRTHNPDIITLQEVDEGSVLSGSFNQLEFLNAQLQYPHHYFASSCSARLFGKNIFVSGNAILSRFPLTNCAAYRFDLTFPTERMGFVIADANLPSGETATIASVHLVWLDWLRRDSRVHELQVVERTIAHKKNLVVAGDFNCEWLGKESSLRDFVQKMDLQVYDPQNPSAFTHPTHDLKVRWDFILTSKNIPFVSYQTLQEKLADHLPVFTAVVLHG